jgi:tRNA(fMet)-specific endonuclease VapC
VTRFLLDTSTVSAVVWKTPDAGVLRKLDEHGGECAICAPVWHELQFGTRHSEERARLERAGKTAPFVDGQIAAIAATCGLPLVTANPADFKQFKGISILNWVSAKSG